MRLPVFYRHANGTVGGRATRFAPSLVHRDNHYRAPIESGSVYFVRNGTVVDQASVERDGRFKVNGVRVGDYTFVVAGPTGVAAFGVSVMPQSAESVNRMHGTKVRSVSSIRLVQGQSGMPDQDVNVDTSDPNDLNRQDLFDEDENERAAGGGGFTGVGGGGGGGFGGGGGLGLLGLGGLAGLAGLAGNEGSTSNIASTGTTH